MKTYLTVSSGTLAQFLEKNAHPLSFNEAAEWNFQNHPEHVPVCYVNGRSPEAYVCKTLQDLTDGLRSDGVQKLWYVIEKVKLTTVA